MLNNFFKTALRNILKYKVYSLLNFIGLSCGLALALLIFTYVRHEVSYDRFQKKSDQLFRIAYTAPNGLKIAASPPPIAPVMKEYFPEVEETARVYGRNMSVAIPGKDDSYEENNVYFADSTLLKMFTFEFMSGNPQKALREPFSVIISDEMSEKYFGSANAVGQSLLFGGKHLMKVAGVFKKYPNNSHIQFNMIAPYQNMFDMESGPAAAILKQNLAVNFIISHSYTYVMLKPGAKAETVDAKMGDFLKKYANPQFLVGQVFTLMPLRDIHLKSELLLEPMPVNNITNIYIFIGVGILTLVIACINYVNLTTAQSLTRLKEIGIRKILGSMKRQLIVQFIAESFLFCLISLALAYMLFYAGLPLLNEITSQRFSFVEVIDSTLVLASIGILVLITFLAGAYPAFFVAKFESIQVLKGAGFTQVGNQFLRKALVVFQLAIASMLLSGALLIFKQLKFLRDKPLGFQKELVINVPLFSNNLNGIFRQDDSTFRSKLQFYLDRVEAETGVKGTSLCSNAPGLGAIYRGAIPDGFTNEDHLFVANMSVDYDFLETFEIELIAGRAFDRKHATDVAEGFIVNETAVREFNWKTPDEALGKTINREGKIGKVIGVVRDFNFTDLTIPVSAMIMEINTNQYNNLAIRFDNRNVTETIEKLRTLWNTTFPEKTFEFNFLDEQLSSQYENFSNFSSMIESFTLVAILISCLGVYGLILFVVQRKVKEIGVRKVLGASILNIMKLTCLDFVWLAALGFILAIPVSYYFLNEWLENFSYHTSIDALSYLISFSLVMFIVLATIAYQAFRASAANPVDSLRSE